MLRIDLRIGGRFLVKLPKALPNYQAIDYVTHFKFCISQDGHCLENQGNQRNVRKSEKGPAKIVKEFKQVIRK